MSDKTPRDPGSAAPKRGAGLLAHAGIVGFFTLLSRLAGLGREMIFAHLFGAGYATDAFVMAFRIPNTFRILVAEGSLTVAFLPVFNEAQKEGGDEAARRVMGQALVVFPSISAILTALCIVFAEPVVRLYASGFAQVPGKLEFTVELVRWMFPYLALISFVALAMGALNARKRFASSAGAPLLFNLVYIAGMVTLSRIIDPPLFGVALGVLAGGVAQVLLQTWALNREGLLVRPSFTVGPEMRRVLRLMLPAILALGVYQINIIVLNQFASYLDEATVSFLWYADRLQQFPLGVFGIAIATASLPAFSDAHVDGGADGLVRSFGRSMRLNAFIIVPAAAGLALLAVPAAAVVYQSGQFTQSMTQATARALLAFSVGLPAVASIRVAGQAFFAMKDTRTPVACGVVGLMGNVAFAPGLAADYGFVGLALSASLAGWLQLITQLFFLRRRLGRIGLSTILEGVSRSLAASLAMGVVVYFAVDRLGNWQAGRTLLNLVLLLLIIGTGAAIYAGVHRILRTPELETMLAGFKRRLGRL